MVASCKNSLCLVRTRGCVLVSSALLCNLAWAAEETEQARNHVRTRQREFLHEATIYRTPLSLVDRYLLQTVNSNLFVFVIGRTSSKSRNFRMHIGRYTKRVGSLCLVAAY